ncbi:MAG: c-type cytochrome [Bacteroidota bacterium]
MKKRIWPKILGGFFILLILLIAGVILYFRFELPSISLKNITVQSTPDLIARGEYLANHVMVCMDCHSRRAWDRFSGPVVPGTLGRGGEVFDQKLGFPGSFSSPNITPYALKDWTDAEIYRAITSGVTKQGKALFPIMPYTYYGTLDTGDILSVIAYLRTLPSVESHPPASEPAFPMSIIVNTIPTIALPSVRPPKEDTLRYGKYLVAAASCVECHTLSKHGQIVKESAFSGGREFQMSDGSILFSANITPDTETGIGRLSREAFIFRFKIYDLTTYTPPTLQKGDMQTIMPWTMYAGMDTTDLAAIYKYIHSLAPVKNQVIRTKQPG